MAFTGAFGYPVIGNRPYITQYDDWRAPVKGEKFDPFVDRYFRLRPRPAFRATLATITSKAFSAQLPAVQRECVDSQDVHGVQGASASSGRAV